LENKRNIKLKLKDIIDDLDLDNLKSFILQYASNDKNFEIALKSHFISRITTGFDESQKYKRVLEEIIKPKNAHNKIGPTQKKMISIVFKDFVLQMNDCLSMDNFTEAYYLLKESLEKIAYLQNRYELKDQNIEACRKYFLAGLELVLDKELAPAFRNKIETELKELADKSYFIPKDVNLIEILNAKNVLVRDEKSSLIEDLIVKCKNKDDYISILKTIIQLSHPFPVLAKKILLKFNHDKIFQAISALIYSGKFEYVDFYINNPKVEFQYNKKILNILKCVEKADFQQLNKELLSLNHEILSILDMRRICEALPETYLRREIDKILPWIENLDFPLKIQMYSKANKNVELLNLLKEKNDIEWLKVYDKTLIERNFKSEVAALYLKISESFLSDHIGVKSKEYLDKIQLHLLKINESKIYHDMYEVLSVKFNHRISLN